MGFDWSGIRELLSAFKNATIAQRAAIVAMGIVGTITLGIPLGVEVPAWAVVIMFVVGVTLIFATAGQLLVLEQKASMSKEQASYSCRQVPTYPPTDDVLNRLNAVLREIREDALSLIQEKFDAVEDESIRSNIFLLAQITGGKSDGEWKLVIHEKLHVNMHNPFETKLQFPVGRGATGVAFRDGEYQFTRRQNSAEGDWEIKFEMTPELEKQVHKDLKWIITFPLLVPNTNEALGVLNIDGLVDISDDDALTNVASAIEPKVREIAQYLSLQPSTCMAVEKLGVIEHV